jgi:hypothetical protein
MANVTRLTLGRADHRFTIRPRGRVTARPPMRFNGCFGGRLVLNLVGYFGVV